MNQRVIRIHSTSRLGAVAIGAGVIVVGGVLVVIGATLLLALAAAGTAVGIGVLAFRKLTGRSPAIPDASRPRVRTLDPSLEVFPEAEPEVRRLPPSA